MVNRNSQLDTIITAKIVNTTVTREGAKKKRKFRQKGKKEERNAHRTGSVDVDDGILSVESDFQ